MDSLNSLPEYLRDKPLFIKICELLDWVAENKAEIDYEKLRNKYNSLFVFDEDYTMQMVSELGYSYIFDILSLTEDEAKVVVNYLNAIHYYKGTRRGLELVLTLLGIVFTLTEWWEDPDRVPPLIPYTFMLDVHVDYSRVTRETIRKLKVFVRDYVYPLWEISYIYLTEIPLVTGGAGFVDREVTVEPVCQLIIASKGAIHATYVADEIII
jgi:hypothetical protein